ncbi:MAG: hypothetical protein ACTSXK_03955 [Promethearchaeota archaeon]
MEARRRQVNLYKSPHWFCAIIYSYILAKFLDKRLYAFLKYNSSVITISAYKVVCVDMAKAEN